MHAAALSSLVINADRKRSSAAASPPQPQTFQGHARGILPWLPALSSSPRNPTTLIPSVSLAGSRQAPTRAQAPPRGCEAVARAGVGRCERSAGRKCSWAFPRGRLPTRRIPGAQIRPGPVHLHPLGSVRNGICCTFS